MILRLSPLPKTAVLVVMQVMVTPVVTLASMHCGPEMQPPGWTSLGRLNRNRAVHVARPSTIRADRPTRWRSALWWWP